MFMRLSLIEASRAREEAWHALRSTLTATRGKVRVIGNVKERQKTGLINSLDVRNRANPE